jgi:hypothetical protein
MAFSPLDNKQKFIFFFPLFTNWKKGAVSQREAGPGQHVGQRRRSGGQLQP